MRLVCGVEGFIKRNPVPQIVFSELNVMGVVVTDVEKAFCIYGYVFFFRFNSVCLLQRGRPSNNVHVLLLHVEVCSLAGPISDVEYKVLGLKRF